LAVGWAQPVAAQPAARQLRLRNRQIPQPVFDRALRRFAIVVIQHSTQSLTTLNLSGNSADCVAGFNDLCQTPMPPVAQDDKKNLPSLQNEVHGSQVAEVRCAIQHPGLLN